MRITREEVGQGFYTYAFLRENGTPYYVGKGRGKRAWTNSNRRAAKRPSDFGSILILKKNLTEEESFRHEKYMIAVLGRKDLGTGILRNLTDGGEGGPGYVVTEEHKLKISEANRGENHYSFRQAFSEEHRRNLSKARRGERNHKAKSFLFTSPLGEVFLVVGQFKAFCRSQGIKYRTMKEALYRNCTPPPRNGWLVRKAMAQSDPEVSVP